jgi:group I intron endonuclease
MVIYLITNKDNGKYYVGKTTKSLEHRWARHLASSRNGKKGLLYNSIRKYGEEGFYIEELQKASNEEELNYLEKMWIFFLKANTRERGYNSTIL